MFRTRIKRTTAVLVVATFMAISTLVTGCGHSLVISTGVWVERCDNDGNNCVKRCEGSGTECVRGDFGSAH